MGMNGRVWINSLSIPHTVTVANAVSNSEYMNNNQIETMVKQLMKRIQSYEKHKSYPLSNSLEFLDGKNKETKNHRFEK